MQKTKNIISKIIISVLCISLLLASAAFGYGSTGTTDDYDQVIVFVHTNDVHGAVDVESVIPTVAAAMKKQYGEENVIIANAGDMWGGATIASLKNGEYIAPIMNAAGYNVMTLGNDDLGRGTDQVLKVAAMNDFPVLSAGYVDAETGEFLMDRYITFQCGDIKVGVFGMTTEEYKPDNNHPTEMLDFDETVQECLAALEEEDCDVVVALTHIGFGDTYEHGSIYLADNFNGIDLIIDGHSHTELPKGYVGETGAFIVQTGQNGTNIGVSKLYIKDGEVVGADTELIPVYVQNDEVRELIADYRALVDEATSQVIGHSNLEMPGERDVLRTSETLVGDVIADAIRDYTGANVAVYPSALIRTGIPEGDVTLNDYLAVFGAGCDIYVVESTGAQLKEILTWGLSKYPESFMAFPQISGMTVTYDAENQEITSIVLDDGTQIGDKDTFTVAIDLLYIDNIGVYDITNQTMIISGQTDMAGILSSFMNQDGFAIPEANARMIIE